jgi:hypothetical protein
VAVQDVPAAAAALTVAQVQVVAVVAGAAELMQGSHAALMLVVVVLPAVHHLEALPWTGQYCMPGCTVVLAGPVLAGKQ